MSFDLDACLRRLKPDKRTGPLSRRPASALAFMDDVDLVGPDLLIDTSVIIDVLQGKAPEKVDQILSARTAYHSTVVLSELTHLFGRLDPKHPETPTTLRSLKATIAGIPGHRLIAPTVRISAEAGILSGLIARMVSRPQDQTLLNDALLHCQAITEGFVLMTGNISDFDLLDQLMPGRVIFYRK